MASAPNHATDFAAASNQISEAAFVRDALHAALRSGMFDVPLQSPSRNCQPEPRRIWPSSFGPEQHDQVHSLVERHLLQTLQGERPPQLLLIVRGEAGSGKTILLKRIAQTFARRQASSSLAVLACSPSAADLVDGTSLTAWASIPRTFSSGGGSALQPASHATNTRLRSVQYIAVDDAAMMGASLLVDLDKRLTTARTPGVEGARFGEANVLLFADWFQNRQLVNSLYAPLPLRIAAGTDSRRLFERFQTATTLPTAPPGPWQDLLRRFRAGQCTPLDTAGVSALVIAPRNEIDFSAQPWIDAPLLTTSASVLKAWTTLATQRFKGDNACTVYRCMSTDMLGDVRLSPEQQELVDGLPLSSTARLPRYLRLAVGMPVIVPFHSTRVLGRIRHIELDSREPITQIVDPASHDVVLRYLPLAIVCKPRDSDGDVRTEPSVGTFIVEGDPVSRTQLRVDVAFAMRFSDVRGRTFDNLIVDLAAPPGAQVTFEEVYSALSRVASADSIRLLRPLHDDLHRILPPPELLTHEIRMDELAASYSV